jgi:hypothetical protein
VRQAFKPYDDVVMGDPGGHGPDEKTVLDLVIAAIAEEREACAKISETATMGPIPILSASEARGAGHGASFMRDKIATAIRGRG